jgi:hypothetical protein
VDPEVKVFDGRSHVVRVEVAIGKVGTREYGINYLLNIVFIRGSRLGLADLRNLTAGFMNKEKESGNLSWLQALEVLLGFPTLTQEGEDKVTV